jgi:hypothetical protein
MEFSMAFIKALLDYIPEVSTSGTVIYIPDTSLIATDFKRNEDTYLQFITVFKKTTVHTIVDAAPIATDVIYYEALSVSLSRVKVVDALELA